MEIITNTSSKGVRQTTTLIPTCHIQEQGTQELPTPQEMAEPNPQVSEIQLVAEDVAEIVHEAPIPPKNPIECLSTPETTLERDLQASERLDAGYVADIFHETRIPPEHTIPNRT